MAIQIGDFGLLDSIPITALLLPNTYRVEDANDFEDYLLHFEDTEIAQYTNTIQLGAIPPVLYGIYQINAMYIYLKELAIPSMPKNDDLIKDLVNNFQIGLMGEHLRRLGKVEFKNRRLLYNESTLAAKQI